MRKAKILATLVPSSNQQSVIEIMLHTGMNAVRIHMSHVEREGNAATIASARAAGAGLGKPLAILVNLSGLKFRTRRLKGSAPVEIKAGQRFTITTRDIEG